jgi:hypothetical protein
MKIARNLRKIVGGGSRMSEMGEHEFIEKFFKDYLNYINNRRKFINDNNVYLNMFKKKIKYDILSNFSLNEVCLIGALNEIIEHLKIKRECEENKINMENSNE